MIKEAVSNRKPDYLEQLSCWQAVARHRLIWVLVEVVRNQIYHGEKRKGKDNVNYSGGRIAPPQTVSLGINSLVSENLVLHSLLTKGICVLNFVLHFIHCFPLSFFLSVSYIPFSSVSHSVFWNTIFKRLLSLFSLPFYRHIHVVYNFLSILVLLSIKRTATFPLPYQHSSIDR